MTRTRPAMVGLPLVAAVLVVAQTLAAASPADAGTGGTCAPSLTRVVSADPPGYSVAYGIDFAGPSDIWSVGQNQNPPARSPSTMIEHWDGNAWTPVPGPATEPGARLSAVRAISPTNVWAVGDQDNQGGGQDHTLVEHFDGSSWSVVSSPHPNTYSDLVALSSVSASDIWAVGTVAATGGGHPLIEHWDGVRWAQVTAPAGKYLASVTARSTSDVWSVGSQYPLSTHRFEPLVAHFNGSAWATVPVPVGADGGQLFGAAVSPDATVWAVGNGTQAIDSVNSLPLIERWDGRSWSVVSSPKVAGALLRALTVVAADDIWAVGSIASETQGTLEPFVEHWDGMAWTVMAVPPPTSNVSRLFAVTHSLSRVWAAGYEQVTNGEHTVYLTQCR